jgi:hypothetical protein
VPVERREQTDDMAAKQSTQPVSAYILLLILGFLPIILVQLFWDDLPHRFVVQWSVAGLTIIGTRAKSAMTIAIGCAAIALFAVLVGAVQNESFRASGIRRLYLALNFVQVITIGLTCAMIVTEAVGLVPFRIRDLIPASAALLLTVAALLCLRLSGGAASRAAAFLFGAVGWLFVLLAVGIIALTVLYIGTPIAFVAIALAALLALLLAIPESPA